jgi:FlaA1/EpsC-like NDP-sugar epimerase
MVLFSAKYKNRQSGFFPGWFIFFGIFIQASINIGASVLKNITPAIIDLFLINATLWLGISLRFGTTHSPYQSGRPELVIVIHGLISACFLLMFIYNGVYVKRRYSALNTFLSAIMASVLFVAMLFFIKSLSFSRIAFALSSIAISIILVFWREIVPQLVQAFKQVLYSPSEIVIVGSGPIAEMVIRDVEELKMGKITGIIWTDTTGKKPGEYEGYPVLGNFSELKNVLKKHSVDTLLISTSHPWYSSIIETLSSLKIKNLNIQWVPHEFFSLSVEQVPSPVPLRNFSV